MGISGLCEVYNDGDYARALGLKHGARKRELLMRKKCYLLHMLVASLAIGSCLLGASSASEAKKNSIEWQAQAVEYARIMSRVKWTPVAGSMPKRRGGYFEEGIEYTGIPYSSVNTVGRCIGFDIYLKTFLAAVENPQSVLYTENLRDNVYNAAPYYGMVCSAFTSYALQCALPYRSTGHDPEFRNGVILVNPQSAHAAGPGDIIYKAPSKFDRGSHVELVTAVKRDGENVVAVRVEESYPPTTRNRLLKASNFDSYISSRNRKLYRVTDLDAWRKQNRAELFLFPNYLEDSAKPAINRVLLLDRGDWVPYFKDQAVKFNVMDKDSQGIQSLVVKRGDAIVEKIALRGKGVIERMFDNCDNYSAHCVMSDGSLSQSCEFSVCDLDFSLPTKSPMIDKPWDIKFTAHNLSVIAVRIVLAKNPFKRQFLWPTDQKGLSGSLTVPAGFIRETGNLIVWLIGENKYGRLIREKKIAIVEEGQDPK